MYEVGTDRENKEQGARRDGGQMMLLHIQQGFILITSGYVFANTKNANAKLKCWYETALKHNLCIVQYHIVH